MNDEEKKIPSYFYFWTKYCDYFDVLTPLQAGETIKYICKYAKGDEAELPEDVACNLLIQIMKQDIDNAFKKYRAQCENGKKGGAPKGNKNAAKKKNQNAHLTINKVDWKIASKITEVLYFEAEKGNYKIDDYLNKRQVAHVAACYYLLDCDAFSELYEGQRSLKEMIEQLTATGACKVLKSCAAEFYEDEQQAVPFDKAFTDAKERATKLLKRPLDELNRFEEKCSEVFLDCSDCDFTNEEFEEIRDARKILSDSENNLKQPKTTQYNQILILN